MNLLTTLLLLAFSFAYGYRMPLTNKMRAPLMAELDISEMNGQLKEYIDGYIKENATHTCRSEITMMVKSEVQNLKHTYADEMNMKNKNMFTVFEHNMTSNFEDLKEKFLFLQQDFVKIKKSLTEENEQHKQRIRDLAQQLKTSNQKVELMVRGVTGLTSSGFVIHFNFVLHHNGISTSYLNNFKSTGKFQCEVEGVYLILTNLISSRSSSWFMIMKDNEEQSRVYIAQHSGSNWHSGTGTALVKLQPGNTVYIEVGGTIDSSSTENTLVIFKV